MPPAVSPVVSGGLRLSGSVGFFAAAPSGSLGASGVPEGHTATGEGYSLAEEMLFKHDVKVVMLENVTGLAQRDSDQEMSDADWIVDRLHTRLKLHACVEQSNAMDFGSPVPNECLYWVGLGDLAEGLATADVIHHSVSFVMFSFFLTFDD